ncbi:hypothetical protein KVP40.0025 [Vibrio phage KVP40]|uniref:Uncharacterized protein n=3 Tax=Schizotequatrovirus KVP40 TaxID=1914019 RepID=Q6WIC6_BPKVM|nr:hypothetical protein KVP40.0025 [Vibrio phage KVP40]AAQ64096.1 hypothetical protein KVP40.0025 [Vibrio phage KVP40]
MTCVIYSHRQRKENIIMTTNRLDWTIEKKAQFIATYKDGTVLVARTREALNSQINEFEKTL